MRAVSMHVHHAIVGVPCFNVVIGVVLGELHVVRVVPVFVCDAVVDITLRSHSCYTVAIVFIVAILRRIFCIGGIVFTLTVGDSKLLLTVTEF